MLQVKDVSLTGSYLDQTIFSDIVKHHHKTNGKPRTIVEWIIHGSYERENSATLVLNSLVMRGILARESKLFGRRYPTVDSGMTIDMLFKYLLYVNKFYICELINKYSWALLTPFS